jgi:hypothetical protein
VKEKSWWLKLDDVSSILRQKCQEYWDIRFHLTVNEIMIFFDGKFIQKIIIPAKFISMNLKFQRLGDKGYIYS